VKQIAARETNCKKSLLLSLVVSFALKEENMWHWGQNEDQRQNSNNFSQESAAQHIVGIGDHNIILFPTFTNDSFLLPHLLRNMFCNDKVENLSSFAPCEH